MLSPYCYRKIQVSAAVINENVQYLLSDPNSNFKRSIIYRIKGMDLRKMNIGDAIAQNLEKLLS